MLGLQEPPREKQAPSHYARPDVHHSLELTQSWRKARPEDEEILFALFAETRRAQLGSLKPALFGIEPLIAMQYRARSMEYTNRFESAANRMLLTRDGSVAGRLLLHRRPWAWRIVDVAVFERFRHHGLATRAIRDIQREADAARVPLHVTLPEGSAALGLFLQLGFLPSETDSSGQLGMTYTRETTHMAGVHSSPMHNLVA